MAIIREITEADSGAFLNLGLELDRQTKFMMLEPGERVVDEQQQAREIRSVLVSGNSMIFVADHDGQLVGFLAARGGAFRRTRHKVHVVIGILEEFTSQGIGTKLFEALETWALETGVHRLELTAMAHNVRGLALYRKMGFAIEGTSVDSLLVDGQYVDEYYLAKLL